jgi:hypothetical protein
MSPTLFTPAPSSTFFARVLISSSLISKSGDFFLARLFSASAIVRSRLSSFFMKRSTWPPESTIRCSPLKNGWHLEQTSVRITGTVDPTVHVLPQAQIT